MIAGSVFIPRIALAAGSCGGAETSVISCEGEGSTAIINIIKQVIKILTAGVFGRGGLVLLYMAHSYIPLLRVVLIR